MPDIDGPLQQEGALVEVLVGWSATSVGQARAGLRPIPPPASAHALLDTGAEVTCLDPALIRQLGLSHRGMTLANVPAVGGLAHAMQFEVRLTVVHPSGQTQLDLVIGDLIVMELALASLGYAMLIGRDVLAACQFLYDGLGNRFRLSY